jgi:hypothetical protein
MKPSPCKIATTPKGNPIDTEEIEICFVSSDLSFSRGRGFELSEFFIQSAMAVMVKLAAIIMAAGR